MIEGLVIGAGIFLAGLVTGRILPGRRAKPKPKLEGPICGCGHHLSYHDDKKGCHERVQVPGFDGWIGETETCNCKKYNGPTPLPEYFAPPLEGS